MVLFDADPDVVSPTPMGMPADYERLMITCIDVATTPPGLTANPILFEAAWNKTFPRQRMSTATSSSACTPPHPKHTSTSSCWSPPGRMGTGRNVARSRRHLATTHRHAPPQ
ncbi:hypothetical protein [Actinoalloteichus fjordicus]|uniref:hypothetical protein n=1 Tax=Actinoalloteichus fjordicus TaxID=1612552 RepID=UPI0012F7539A|nr:hypothetical protein [Actinoalloteichus fjordicus]